MKTGPSPNPWHSPARLALWVALPMARTPKMETRLTMILDTTRCRRLLHRRVLFTALCLSGVALSCLAALRPTAETQAVAAADDYAAVLPDGNWVKLVGLAELAFPETTKGWHTPRGVPLSHAPSAIPQGWSVGSNTLPSPHYVLAFRLSPAIPSDATFLYEAPGSDGTLTPPQETHRGGLRLLGLMYPADVRRAPMVEVGVASGPWEVIQNNAFMGSIGAGGMTFKGNSYLFSPIRADVGGSSLTVTIGSPRMNYRLMAVDKQGRTRLPVTVDDTSNEDSLHFIQQITAHFDLPASQIQTVRVEARPFRWIEFKDVTLQPQSAMEGARP